MTKTLAQQVAAFMEAEKVPTPEAMAKLVRAEQKKRGGKQTVKRQNIEGVTADRVKRPLYLVELALAMGTTAETLLAGKFVPSGAEPEPAEDPLPAALTLVATTLAESDKFARVWPRVSRLLTSVSEEPSNIGTFSHDLEQLIPWSQTAVRVGENGHESSFHLKPDTLSPLNEKPPPVPKKRRHG